jgi:hypothetical protein
MSAEQPKIEVPVATNVALPANVIIEMPKNDGEIGATVVIPMNLNTGTVELKDIVK